MELSRVAQLTTSPRLVVPVRLRKHGAARGGGGRLGPPGGARGRRLVVGVEPAVRVRLRLRLRLRLRVRVRVRLRLRVRVRGWRRTARGACTRAG